MATRTLVTSYLARLTNANHDGVTQQILTRLQSAEIENEMYAQSIVGVRTARQAEDEAYCRYSGKDFVSDDLKAADQLMDKYMSAIHGILNGMLYLPDTETKRRKAQLAVQLFKDFNFMTNDGIEAEARKATNMVQQWKVATEYTLVELGIDEWVEKAGQQAVQVLALVAQRVEHESAKVKGELAEARKQTDQAIRKAYDVLNAMVVLQPSDEVTQLMSLLFSIEDRAKLYYISNGKTGGDDKPTPAPDGGESAAVAGAGGSAATEGGDGQSADGGESQKSEAVGQSAAGE